MKSFLLIANYNEAIKLRSREDFITMAGNRVICTVNQVDYATIRKAMCSGARTREEIAEMTNACLTCEGCAKELDGILNSVCGCKSVSRADVLEAIKNGADTVEKVGAVTAAGTGQDCGRCQSLIANMIELGR